jgi:hypothetical protein
VLSLHWAGTATLTGFADPNGTTNRWDLLTQHTANGCGVALLLGQIQAVVTTAQTFVATYSAAATDRGACIASLTAEPLWGVGPLAPVGAAAAVTTLQVLPPADANGGRHMTVSAFTRTVPGVTSTAGGGMTNRFDAVDGTLRMVQQTRNLSDGSAQFPQITWVGAGNVVGVASTLRAEPQASVVSVNQNDRNATT